MGRAAGVLGMLAVAAAACGRTPPGDGLPRAAPDVAGLITQVVRANGGPATIFVETDPSDAPRIGRGSPKANVAIAASTRVLQRQADGRYTSVDPRVLVLGRVVRVWYDARAARPDPRVAVAAVIALQPAR